MKVFRVVQLTRGELHQVGRLYGSARHAKGQRTRRINDFIATRATGAEVTSYAARLAIQEAELDWKGIQ